MALKDDKAQVWIKPEMTKLGTLKDVAGGVGIGTQSSQQNRS